MNVGDEERGPAGINILWPVVNNDYYQSALLEAEAGNSPNNISPIFTYHLENSGKFLWMGDLETDFIENIKYQVDWPDIDVLFAPHHGRDSGKIPEEILAVMNPGIIVLGEAPSANLNYYSNYNTITQNSAGTIAFECVNGGFHIYVSRENYSVGFLQDCGGTTYTNYIGTLVT